MTAFYERLASHYDAIFPAEPEITAFLARAFEGKRMLLDIACGTGTYARELATLGFRVTGIDIEERMIRLANSKDLPQAAEFYVADMTGGAASEKVFGRKYDGIYCIGNSLPHLAGMEQVGIALALWSAALHPGGVLVLQTVNFRRFHGKGETGLPSIEREGLIFSRRYETADPDTVYFVTKLALLQTGEELENKVRLLVIKPDLLDRSLQEVGFGDPVFYGSFAGAPYRDDSFLTICLARKM